MPKVETSGLSRTLAAACLGSVALFASAPENALYPDRTIELIVPYAPGGTTDVVARIVASQLADILGQSVIVQNQPGAGGSLGSAAAARAEPDGYTLVMAVESSHAVNPSVYSQPAYDPVADFSPIGTIANVSGVLVVGPDVPSASFEEFVEALRTAPGEFAFASSGNGGYSHLFAEVFMAETGTDMVHVPYSGLGPALVDVMAGQVEAVFDNLPSAIGQIESGTVRALAVSAPERSPSLPDVPTYAELGIEALNTPSWYGLAAPAGVPDDVLHRLNAALREAVEDPAVAERLLAQGADPAPSSREEFGAIIAESNERWRTVVERIGFERF